MASLRFEFSCSTEYKVRKEYGEILGPAVLENRWLGNEKASRRKSKKIAFFFY
jgi:hypothetical protein